MNFDLLSTMTTILMSFLIFGTPYTTYLFLSRN